MNLKVMVRVRRENGHEWTHFCYISSSTYMIVKNRFSDSPSKLVNKWAKSNFGLTLETWADLQLLREKIKDVYKDKYPELYTDGTCIDSQGWSRVWFSDNLLKELKEAETNG